MRRKLWLSFTVLVLMLLVAEGVVRGRNYLQHGTFGRIYTFAIHEPSGLKIPVPGSTTERIAIDSRGFRSPELDDPKPDGRLRLAFVGGSTTFCAETSGNDATWPALVVAAARAAHPDADVDWLNAAVGGFAADTSIDNFRHRVAPLVPDVVVVYHATNDLSKDTRALARATGVYEGDPDGDSWLAGWSLAWFLLEKNLAHRERAVVDPDTPKLALDPATIAPGFADRLRTLVADAQAAGALVVLPTFSARLRSGQSAAELEAAAVSSLYYMPYLTPESILAGFEAYNAEIRRVAAETGALLVEAADAIPADAEHFVDSVHFTDAGAARMAELVGTALLAWEPFVQRVEGAR